MIKNFYEMEPSHVGSSHDGAGTVKVVDIFEKFESKMQFFHYTVLPPGASIGLHKHGNDEEFYVVLGGEGEMEVDGVKQMVTAGCAILNKPFGSHRLRNTSETKELRILVFEVKV